MDTEAGPRAGNDRAGSGGQGGADELEDRLDGVLFDSARTIASSRALVGSIDELLARSRALLNGESPQA